MEFEHVLVVGAGQMGGGIAQVVAASGRRVSLHDPFPGATDARSRRCAEPREARREGRRRPGRGLARIEPADGLVPADLMIEAVVEDAAVKEEVFRRADALLPPDAILASNTSSIPIGSLAAVTGRPDRVIGMHFFNPVPVLKLVEVIRGRADLRRDRRGDRRARPGARQGAGRGARRPGLRLEPDPDAVHQRGGLRAADGVAEAEAIDTVAKLGFGHPMGPLALADLIGLDTCVAIMEVLERGLGDPKYAPCPLLREHVAGRPARPQVGPRLLHVLAVERARLGGRHEQRCRVAEKTSSSSEYAA